MESTSQKQQQKIQKICQLPLKKTWILQRTLKAVEYYKNNKLQDLKHAKQKFFQKINQRKQAESISEKNQIKKMKKKKRKRKTSEGTRKSQRSLSKKSLNQQTVRQDLSIIDVDQQLVEEQVNNQADSCLSEEGKYELKQIHYCILQFQKIIDAYLDYQFSVRKRISLTQAQLSKYLKTTQYGYFSQKYLGYLQFYNKDLYFWDEQNIFCWAISAQMIKQRYDQTKTLMTRKYSIQMNLLFN